MGDIFDQVAAKPKAATGDIFDQIAPTPVGQPEVNAAIASVPRPKAPDMQADPISPFQEGFAGTEDSVLKPGDNRFLNAEDRTLGQETRAGLDTITGIPSALYHAFADKPTSEEIEKHGADEVSGAKRVGLGVERLAVNPVENAAKWYSDAASGKVPHPLDQALSVASQAVGSAAGSMVAGKLAETGTDAATEAARDYVPQRLMNALVRTRPKGFNYGRNPGQGVADEGIVAGSKSAMLDKIGQHLEDTGAQINQHLSDPAVNKPTIDITNAVLDPINQMETAAIKGKNLTLADNLAELRDRLTNDYARGPNGKLTPTGATKLSGLTPLEANAIKQDIGKMAKWKGPGFEAQDQMSPALHQIYGQINDRIEAAAPGIKDINQRYGELLSAQESMDRANRLGSTYNPLGSLSDMLAGLGWGPAGYLTTKAIRSTPGMTLVAQAARKLPQTVAPVPTALSGAVAAQQGSQPSLDTLKKAAQR